jgi:AmiR/NasT family two-component response regulator
MSTVRVGSRETEELRVVVADERADALEHAAELVRAAGHAVVAAEIEHERAAAAAADHAAEVVVVAVHRDVAHALLLVDRLDDAGRCPVVLLLDADDPALIDAALDRGVTAYADRATPGALQAAIGLAQRRFAERTAQPGTERRAIVEQAKGVLMERHDIEEAEAYRRLRGRARDERVSVADIAAAVLRSRSLLSARRADERKAFPAPPPDVL